MKKTQIVLALSFSLFICLSLSITSCTDKNKDKEKINPKVNYSGTKFLIVDRVVNYPSYPLERGTRKGIDYSKIKVNYTLIGENGGVIDTIKDPKNCNFGYFDEFTVNIDKSYEKLKIEASFTSTDTVKFNCNSNECFGYIHCVIFQSSFKGNDKFYHNHFGLDDWAPINGKPISKPYGIYKNPIKTIN